LGGEAEGSRNVVGLGEPEHNCTLVQATLLLQIKQAFDGLRKCIRGGLDIGVKLRDVPSSTPRLNRVEANGEKLGGFPLGKATSLREYSKWRCRNH
jgi:hypothetical protein